MSTQGDVDAAFILSYEENTIGLYMTGARLTLLILDYVLNLDREVQLFWKRPRSAAALLYFTMRWTSMISATLAVLVPTTATSPNTCNAMTLANYAITASEYLPRALFSAMRAYGLLNNSIVACLVLVLALVPLGVNLSVYATGLQGVIIPVFGCLQASSAVPFALMIGLNFVVWATIMGSDIILIAITWWITPRRGIIPDQSQIQRKGRREPSGFHPGLMYFLAQLLMDTFSIVVHILSIFDTALPQSGPLNNFLQYMVFFIFPVTSILIAHFLLDLQEAGSRTLRLNSDGPLDSEASMDQQSSLNFATRIVGSLGAVIDYSTSNEEDLVDEDP